MVGDVGCAPLLNTAYTEKLIKLEVRGKLCCVA